MRGVGASDTDRARIDATADEAVRALDATWDRLARSRDAEDAQRVAIFAEQVKTILWLELIAERLKPDSAAGVTARYIPFATNGTIGAGSPIAGRQRVATPVPARFSGRYWMANFSRG